MRDCKNELLENKIATITDVDTEYKHNQIWMQLCCDTPFPIQHVFIVNNLSDITRIHEIRKFIGVDNVKDFEGSQVRIIVESRGKIWYEVLAIGATHKNKFIDLYGDEFPVSERNIFIRYKLAKERKAFINALKAKWDVLRKHLGL